MKEMLLLLARYNKNANAAMLECMQDMPFEDVCADMGLFYVSPMGTMEHCLGGDITMFGGFFKSFCKNPASIDSPVLKLGSWAGVTPEVKKDIVSFAAARAEMDDVIIKVIENIEDFSKIETLEFPGVKFEKPRYQLIAGLLTHSTHHRGQIAGALDIVGVDNDFAGMLGI